MEGNNGVLVVVVSFVDSGGRMVSSSVMIWLYCNNVDDRCVQALLRLLLRVLPVVCSVGIVWQWNPTSGWNADVVVIDDNVHTSMDDRKSSTPFDVTIVECTILMVKVRKYLLAALKRIPRRDMIPF
jgi:hypothetical protein